MSYEPRPGSVPDRVIAHLRTLPHVAERLSSQLAAAINAPPAHVTACLDGAATAGAIFRRKKDAHIRAPVYWSLVDHSNANGSAPAPATQPEAAKKTPHEGANRAASAGQSHGAGGSESPPGRGTDGAPALGAAPVFIPTQGPQHVLKAEAARPDATDRGAPAYASPVGGPTGAGQAAAAAPAGLRIALWSDGTLQICRGAACVLQLPRDDARALVKYLDSIALDDLREPVA
jgi:hypothetical protein